MDLVMKEHFVLFLICSTTALVDGRPTSGWKCNIIKRHMPSLEISVPSGSVDYSIAIGKADSICIIGDNFRKLEPLYCDPSWHQDEMVDLTHFMRWHCQGLRKCSLDPNLLDFKLPTLCKNNNGTWMIRVIYRFDVVDDCQNINWRFSKTTRTCVIPLPDMNFTETPQCIAKYGNSVQWIHDDNLIHRMLGLTNVSSLIANVSLWTLKHDLQPPMTGQDLRDLCATIDFPSCKDHMPRWNIQGSYLCCFKNEPTEKVPMCMSYPNCKVLISTLKDPNAMVSKTRRVPVKCPSIMKFGLQWPVTDHNKTQSQPCPNLHNRNATWYCSADGKWIQNPDMSNCSNFDEFWNGFLNNFNESNLVGLLNTLVNNIIQSGLSFEAGDVIRGVKILQNITLCNPNATKTLRQNDIDNFIQALIYLIDEIVQVPSAWWTLPNLSATASTLFTLIDCIGLRAASLNVSDNFMADNIVITTEAFPIEKVRNLSIHHVYGQSNGSYIQLPNLTEEVTLGEVLQVTHVTYETMHMILDENYSAINSSEDVEHMVQIVNSRIVGTSLGCVNRSTFRFSYGNVRIMLSHLLDTDEVYNLSNPTCVFWDLMSGEWNPNGCWLIESTNSYTICGSDRLEYMAVLFEYAGMMHPKIELVITHVTSFGCCISLVCILLSLIIFMTLRRLDSIRVFVHWNLCFSMMLAEVSLLVGLGLTEHPYICKLAAMAIHYTSLSSFLWLMIEGHQVYVNIVLETETYRYPPGRLITAIFGYGAPALIVFLCSYLHWDGYGTPHFCWLRKGTGFIWAFVAPSAFSILVTIGFLLLALIKSRRVVTPIPTADKVDVKPRMWILGTASVALALGLTWEVGFIYLHQGLEMLYDMLELAFAACNCLQGAALFLFHCMLNVKLRDQLFMKMEENNPPNNVKGGKKSEPARAVGAQNKNAANANNKKLLKIWS